jgi:hypothetical protein
VCYNDNMNAITPTVIIARNYDGDIVCVVDPVDALNPGFTADEVLERKGIGSTEIVPVISLRTFRERCEA